MEPEDAASRRRSRFQNFLKSHPPIGSHVNVFGVYEPFGLRLCKLLRFLSCVKSFELDANGIVLCISLCFLLFHSAPLQRSMHVHECASNPLLIAVM